MSPLCEEAQQLYRNQTALLFTDLVHTTEARERRYTLESILGTRWTRDEVREMFSKEAGDGAGTNNVVHIPLAFWITPQAQDQLMSIFGSKSKPPDWIDPGEEVVEGFDLPRDEFIRIASMFSPLTNTGPN